jgi:dTDP-4-dehydrorhamnose 3,5-epimerase
VQDNVAFSRRDVLRGLHFQYPRPQAKLVSVLQGAVFDVAVDLRRGSATFGRWAGYALSADDGKQLYVPGGFAHGYLVTSDTAVVMYKCTAYYDPPAEVTLAWNDPDVAIDWPLRGPPVLSVKDAAAPRLASLDRDHLPP